MKAIARPAFSPTALGLLCLLSLLSAVSCHQSAQPTPSQGVAPAAQRRPLKGKVVSLDQKTATANIDAEAIDGFMDAMTMAYSVQPATVLGRLSPGDAISAVVVVEGNKYWLENVVVTQPAKAGLRPPTNTLHIPSPREPVPDFELINQTGQPISLARYRGKALLVTFIYVRCPFPDYCPRVSAAFAQINRELRTHAALYRQTHLLSISIDPGHDTPKELRNYGFACGGSKQPALFDHWEFAVPRAAQLPEIANFFGLTIADDGGLITHSLSTAVIGPDGRIYRWYSGSDWQPADLIKDAAGAMHATI
jgi:protein SCO1/2